MSLNSPTTQWRDMPSFLIGEYTFFLITLGALMHAAKTSRQNLCIFFAALLAGTANDYFFILLPIVNNFWQAQATVMLTARMPLYIPCVYICFLYYPAVACRNWFGDNLDSKPRSFADRITLAALSGLVIMIFYWPYDIIGAKYLWWTWHDTDTPIADRVHGAPASSTLWTLTFGCNFAYIVDFALERFVARQKKSAGGGGAVLDFFASFWPVFVFSTPVMMMQMGILQFAEPRWAPGYNALFFGIVIFACVALYGLMPRLAAGCSGNKKMKKTPRLDREERRMRHHFVGCVVMYAVVLIAIGHHFDSKTHKSYGIHQLTGPCGVKAIDISGNERELYLCVKKYDEPYDFSCVSKPPGEKEEWYTVCGKAHASAEAKLQWWFGLTWRAVLAAVVIACMMLFG